jgi:hypothetical protein
MDMFHTCSRRPGSVRRNSGTIFLSLGCRQPDRPGQRAPGSSREGFGGEIREGTRGAGGGRLRAGGERRTFGDRPQLNGRKHAGNPVDRHQTPVRQSR